MFHTPIIGNGHMTVQNAPRFCPCESSACSASSRVRYGTCFRVNNSRDSTMLFHLTISSGNVKTGPIPVSTSSSKTCPPICPFIKAGCYASAGPLGMHWRKVSKKERGANWRSFLATVRALPAGILWRHNQAGDLPGVGNRINRKMMRELSSAAKHTGGFTYTHKPVLGNSATARSNRDAIRQSELTINLSGNNLAHADKLADLNIAPVVAVLPTDAPRVTFTPAGRRVVTCPAQTRDNVTCQSCGLCARKNRNGVIIGFLAHGASRRKADAIARA